MGQYHFISNFKRFHFCHVCANYEKPNSTKFKQAEVAVVGICSSVKTPERTRQNNPPCVGTFLCQLALVTILNLSFYWILCILCSQFHPEKTFFFYAVGFVNTCFHRSVNISLILVSKLGLNGKVVTWKTLLSHPFLKPYITEKHFKSTFKRNCLFDFL